MMKKNIILFDIDYTLFDTDVFKNTGRETFQLYEETQNVLEKLSRIARLGIFSEGDQLLQMQKLKKTNILPFFLKDNIHIVSLKMEIIKSVLGIYIKQNVYFVDDKLPVLIEAKTLYPEITTIWIKRGIYANTQKLVPHFSADAIIMNLQELLPIFSINV